MKFIWGILIASLTIFLLFFIYPSDDNSVITIESDSLTVSEIQKIQDGDIILRRGDGLVSDLIVESLKQKYAVSHCGIICIDKNKKRSVIHSVSSALSDFDGLQEEDFDSFIKSSLKNSIIIVRLKNHKDNDLKKISNKARYYLKKKVPFDNKFDFEDSTKLSCNELIDNILKSEFNFTIYSKADNITKKGYNFDVFTNSSFFDIIINHQLNK